MNNRFDRAAYLAEFNTEVGEHDTPCAFALPHQPQQQMLRADVVMVEAPRLLLCQDQHLLGPRREQVETTARRSRAGSLLPPRTAAGIATIFLLLLVVLPTLDIGRERLDGLA